MKLECSICALSFSTTYEMRKHCRIHISKNGYCCCFCNLVLEERTDFHQHFLQCYEVNRSTTAVFEKRCRVCGSFFSDSRNLANHMKFHNPDKQFVCQVCYYSFTEPYMLDTHVQIYHNPRSSNRCPLCSLNFTSRPALHVHIACHTGEKPFKCNVCHLALATDTKMRKHLSTHNCPPKSEITNTSTEIIGACDNNNLSNTYTLEVFNPNKMDTCEVVLHTSHDGQFVSESQNSIVQPTNTKNNKRLEASRCYKCPLCLYKTNVKSSASKHIRTHEKSRLKCPACGVGLASKHNIGRHRKKYCTAISLLLPDGYPPTTQT